MCLITDKQPQIAETDITVYKILLPMVAGFDYHKNYLGDVVHLAGGDLTERVPIYYVRAFEKKAIKDNPANILEGRAHSVHERFIYEFGKLYQAQMERENGYAMYGSDDEITEIEDQYGPNWRERLHENKLISIGPGFHSADRPDRLDGSGDARYICRCTIPKGSTYYVGFGGLMVSDQIIINEIIERKGFPNVPNN